METPEKATTPEEAATETPPEEKVIDMDTVCRIIDSFPSRSRQFLIPMMSKLQLEFRYLPEEIIDLLVQEMKITRAEIYGVISFYHLFRSFKHHFSSFVTCQNNRTGHISISTIL